MNNNKTVTSTTMNNKIVEEAPFWFGTEEPFQIHHILRLYERHIKLNHQRPQNARSPWQFIGKVARKIQSFHPKFKTLDDVYVYENRCVCQGKTMPLLKRYCFETTWCRLEGVPQHFAPLQAIDLDEQQDQLSNLPTFYLYAFPEFSEQPEKHNSFQYASSNCQYTISHAGNENLVLAHCEPFFRRTLATTCKDIDDEVQVEEFEECDENYDEDDSQHNPFLNNEKCQDEEEEVESGEDDVVVTGSSPTKIHEDYFQALLAGSGSKKNSPCTPKIPSVTFTFEFEWSINDSDEQEENDDNDDNFGDNDDDELQQDSEDEFVCECSSPYQEEQEDDDNSFLGTRDRGFIVSCKN